MRWDSSEGLGNRKTWATDQRSFLKTLTWGFVCIPGHRHWAWGAAQTHLPASAVNTKLSEDSWSSQREDHTGGPGQREQTYQNDVPVDGVVRSSMSSIINITVLRQPAAGGTDFLRRLPVSLRRRLHEHGAPGFLSLSGVALPPWWGKPSPVFPYWVKLIY